MKRRTGLSSTREVSFSLVEALSPASDMWRAVGDAYSVVMGADLTARVEGRVGANARAHGEVDRRPARKRRERFIVERMLLG
mmetsp:Transcript_3310/g.5903  ORF Transcript_3310/g.5903 Transcript_3310/m.5903 type:complete len:82 (-) Transcript_3310:59-304(-)